MSRRSSRLAAKVAVESGAVEGGQNSNSVVQSAIVSFEKLRDNVTPVANQVWETVESKWNDVSGLQLVVAALPVVFTIALWSFPVFRWHLVLFFYMPTLSGLYIKLDWLVPYYHAYLEWELDTFPHNFAPQSVVEINADEFSWAEFYRRSEGFRRATVIRGLFKDTVAAETWGSDEWVDNYHNYTVQSVKDINKAGFKFDYEMTVEPFDEFFRSLKSGNVKYSYGLDEVYNAHPSLVSDLELSRFGKHDGRDYNFCQSVALFVSSGAKGLRYHDANNANLAIQLQGTKVWHLIDPHYSLFMGPEGNDNPYVTGFTAQTPEHIVTRLPEIHVTANAGDVLFNPVWWWHSIDSTADPETGVNMMNTCRFGSIESSLKSNVVFELFRHMRFINYLQPNMPLFVRYIPFWRVIQDGVREYFGWMPHWDADDCYSSKRAACEAYFVKSGVDVSQWEK